MDYEGILVSLESDIPVEIAPSFTTPPPPEFTTMDDPVADPNESWRDWLKRVVDFELPPQVERNSLPQELQP